MKRRLILLIAMCNVLSCQEQDEVSPRDLYRSTYHSMLDTLRMGCIGGYLGSWFKGTVARQETCHLSNRDGRELVYSIYDEAYTQATPPTCG